MDRSRYNEVMREGAAEYGDVLEALKTRGLSAEFIQTGGMNAAITATIEADYYLMIAGQEDSLAWDRAALDGWYVGLYAPDSNDQPQPLRWLTSDRSEVDELLTLVDRVLDPTAD